MKGHHGNSPVVARSYLIRGRVQGVGFRYFTERIALDMGLRGFVRNLADGRVEVFAIGTAEELDELYGHLSRGPKFAEVRGIEQSEEAVVRYTGFRIES